MLKKMTGTFVLIGALALVGGPPALAGSPDETERAQHGAEMQESSPASGERAACCEKLKKHMEKMQAACEQRQDEMEKLLARMNATSGEEQQGAMAELLTNMVEQRRAMHDMMQKRRSMMMHHMSSGETGGMDPCPMMRQMMEKRSHECPRETSEEPEK